MRSVLRILLVEILILGFGNLAQAQFPDQGNAPQGRPGGQTPAQNDGASQRGDGSRPVPVMPILGNPEPVTAPSETGVQGTTSGQQQIDNRSTQPPPNRSATFFDSCSAPAKGVNLMPR